MSNNQQSVLGKVWHIATYQPLPENTQENMKASDAIGKQLPDFLLKLLEMRGIAPEQISDFFEPRLKNLLPDPYLLPDMQKAVQRLAEAVIHQEKIAIYSDYDVDGACSAALFIRYFRALNVPFLFYIPSREKDGYGVRLEVLQSLQSQGAELILCADCGTGFDLPTDFGTDTLVFDHHQAQSDSHPFYAFVNPMRRDDKSGQKQICAAAICYLTLIGLNRCLRDECGLTDLPDLIHELDLVALATIADVMPLLGLNRAFVSQGLKMMNRNGNIGLKSLNQLMRHGKTINNSEDISFGLAPALNAGGRMGESLVATQLLISQTEEAAAYEAERLKKLNALRSQIQNDTLKSANALVKTYGWEDDNVILVAAENLHIGVTGIVAGRLKETYHVPALVVSYDDDGYGTGSARSVDGIDIAALLNQAVEAEILSRAGGHKMAGGFGLMHAQEDAFRQFLQQQLQGVENSTKQKQFLLDIDVICTIPQLGNSQIGWLEKLSPFGNGNQEPVVMVPQLRVSYHQLVGKNKTHLQITGQNQAGENLRMVMFSVPNPMLEAVQTYQQSGQLIDVAGYLRVNEYQGKKRVDLHLNDLRPIA
ncbi:MAG: single-stranded-DNA-specific exonuclease RecJ [Alphaproteobacteria bacterium]|nr:single-stranded-DNA-specific exonuclease RecJ [Alphaproteobacteria bacterium]